MDSFAIVFNCLTIKGTFVGNRKDVDDAIEFLANGSVKVKISIFFFSNVKLHDMLNFFEILLV